MTAPLVSVVVPTYQGAAHIEECLRSALAQTHRDLEVVVVDDGSTDGTLEVVRRVDDPRVRVLAGADRCGVAANWNRGVAAARGRYIKLLCQDDRLHPGCIAREVTAITDRRGLGFVAVGRRVIDGRGRVLVPRVRATSVARTVTRQTVIRSCLERGGNVIGEPSAVLFDRELWQRVGGFRDAQYVIDLDLWLRLLEHGDAALLPTALADFRVHDRSWSASLRAEQRSETRAVLLSAAASSGLPTQRSFAPRVHGRWIGRSLVFGLSRLTSPGVRGASVALVER